VHQGRISAAVIEAVVGKRSGLAQKFLVLEERMIPLTAFEGAVNKDGGLRHEFKKTRI
jgi:hypothetical protein